MDLIASACCTSDSAAAFGMNLLRAGIAWIFLWPLPGLIRNFQATVQTTALVFPMARCTTIIGLLVMALGALSVAVGIFPRVGAAALALYCIGGAFVHKALARRIQTLAEHASDRSGEVTEIAQLGTLGHVTSAWKNWPIAAACAYIAFAGAGPGVFLTICDLCGGACTQ
ncbi:MAG: DoxX family protein [Phycisphaerales bacterium]|nr:DoxX family protein [Phycisphaerales bacterium]